MCYSSKVCESINHFPKLNLVLTHLMIKIHRYRDPHLKLSESESSLGPWELDFYQAVLLTHMIWQI